MILLDTHAWIWHLAERSELSEAARAAIDRERAPGSIMVSAISVWELFMLTKTGRLRLSTSPRAFVASTELDPTLRIVPVDAQIGRASVELPDYHADPADRMIIATASELGCGIVSKDGRFADYQAIVQMIW